jgi:hypothetical protein
MPSTRYNNLSHIKDTKVASRLHLTSSRPLFPVVVLFLCVRVLWFSRKWKVQQLIDKCPTPRDASQFIVQNSLSHFCTYVIKYVLYFKAQLMRMRLCLSWSYQGMLNVSNMQPVWEKHEMLTQLWRHNVTRRTNLKEHLTLEGFVYGIHATRGGLLRTRY